MKITVAGRAVVERERKEEKKRKNKKGLFACLDKKKRSGLLGRCGVPGERAVTLKSEGLFA